MGLLSLSIDEATKEISSSNPIITIVGLGKMGLPLAMVFTHYGYQVIGYDISQQRVEDLNNGLGGLPNEPFVQDRLEAALSSNLFSATSNFNEAVGGSSFVIIIIPVMIDDVGKVDLSNLVKLFEDLSKTIPDECIIIQESTLPPTTTSKILKPILEAHGKLSGKDFGLVFAPERTFSGRAIDDIENRYPKLIGGDTTNAGNIASVLYEQVCQMGVIQLRDATTAEAVKTFKGAYRDANIAIANHFAVLADMYGVDVLEVIDAANTEPFSHIHQPGIGVGGHCIPVYPYFLISEGKSQGAEPTLLSSARDVNDSMVDYCIAILDKRLENWDLDILVLGLAYRGGVKEARLSPTLRLVPELRLKGARVSVADPLYLIDELDQAFGTGGMEWQPHILADFKVIMIVTDHQEFKGLEEYFADKIIVDGRYVVDSKKSTSFTLLQPGRIALS